MMSKKLFMEAAIEAVRKAETDLSADVEEALRKAYEKEGVKAAKVSLGEILKNVEVARQKKIPICQDTGVLNFYVGLGSKAGLGEGEIREMLSEAARIATEEVPLRPNAVHPLTRKNSGDNTGKNIPFVEFEALEGKDYVDVLVFPKGAGSENMSQLEMLNPADGIGGVKRFVLKAVVDAGGRPCPPGIVGVGIGGSAEIATRSAKKALFRKAAERNPDPEFAAIEAELEENINRLGIGAMGLGGDVSCLAVHIEYSFCHTGSLPVAVNIGCWATRKAKVRIREKGFEFL